VAEVRWIETAGHQEDAIFRIATKYRWVYTSYATEGLSSRWYVMSDVGTEKRREKVDSYRMRSEGSIYREWSIWSISDQQCYVVVTIW
jgi:hypothetical protein